MHDVIRDVALSIWKLEFGKEVWVKSDVQEWPEKSACEGYSAIVLHDAWIDELPDELVCPQLHTLRLQHTFLMLYCLQVPDNFFSAMQNLTVLYLGNICLSSSLAKLVNLRMLSLHSCKLEDTSIFKDLKKSLEILRLGSVTDDMLLLIIEVRHLTRLRLLDLRTCHSLKAIPRGVISNLTRLEELHVPDTYDQWEGTTADVERSNASLDELCSLTRLTSLDIHITNVVTLPKDFRFDKLIRFQISVGKKFEYHEKHVPWTKILKLSGITLEDDQFSVLLDRAEVVYLEKLQYLKKVIHNRGGVRFSNVKYLVVKNCDDLEYLFSSSCARGPLQLQHLEIKDCQMIEKIVGIFEGEKDEEELTNKVVNFSQLKYMMLEKLPNLISFYSRMKKIATPEGNSSTHSQPLFNVKVAFPALERLEIGDVPNIKEIWDEQLPTGPEIAAASFPKLTVMKVYKLAKFMHVVSSAMLSLLQKIRELHVRDCGMMEMIISEKAKEKEPIRDNIIVLHQLRALSLCNLPKLKSFCSNITTTEGPLAIFNRQVAFPALKELNIRDLPNFTKIWDEQLLPVPESLPILTVMKVYKCAKLVHVVSFDMLPVLQKIRELRLRDCGMMEVIVSEKAIENEPFVFPQLRVLSLGNLPTLQSFCNSITTSEAPLAMFNYQFAFPVLEELSISNVPNITRMWDQKLLSAESFSQLKTLKLKNFKGIWASVFGAQPFNPKVVAFPKLTTLSLINCVNSLSPHVLQRLQNLDKLIVRNVDFSPPHMLRRSQNLRKLIVRNVNGLEEVFYGLDQLNVGPEGQHVGLLTDNKMEVIILDGLPQLTSLWNKEPYTGILLGNLKYLVIGNCPRLRNLFTSSVAMALEQLYELHLISCTRMEEVIVATNQGGDKAQVIDDHEIVFPNLTEILLADMPTLRGFCNSNINLQSLEVVHIRSCPKMKTFTLGQGQICITPQIRIYTSRPNVYSGDSDDDEIEIEDLNTYLQQRVLEGEDNDDKDKEDYNDFFNESTEGLDSYSDSSDDD